MARRPEHVIEKSSIELLVPWTGIGPSPVTTMLRSNELPAERVLPTIGITLDRFVPTMRPEFDTPRWTEATPGEPMPLPMGGRGPYRF